jgi:hypothetical protein
MTWGKKKTRAVKGCRRAVYGNGYCRPHNRRFRLYGDPLHEPRVTTRVIRGVRHKRCSRCGQFKPEAEFWFANKAKGYRHTVCNVCISERSKQRYQERLRIKCKVPGCTRGIVQKNLGLCAMHRERLRTIGSVGPAQSVGELNSGPCKVPGCTGHVTSRQLCQTGPLQNPVVVGGRCAAGRERATVPVPRIQPYFESRFRLMAAAVRYA